jgi:hypothetical protein
MHYALCTIHYALYTMHYTLCTIHYALYTMHYTLHTLYSCTILHQGMVTAGEYNEYTLYTILMHYITSGYGSDGESDGGGDDGRGGGSGGSTIFGGQVSRMSELVDPVPPPPAMEVGQVAIYVPQRNRSVHPLPVHPLLHSLYSYSLLTIRSLYSYSLQVDGDDGLHACCEGESEGSTCVLLLHAQKPANQPHFVVDATNQPTVYCYASQPTNRHTQPTNRHSFNNPA